MCGGDSRHSHIAAIYDDVSELLASQLIWQLQSVGGPQWLMETSQASHRGCRGVVCGRSPGSDPVKPHVANGLIWRGRGPSDGLSWLRRTIKTQVSASIKVGLCQTNWKHEIIYIYREKLSLPTKIILLVQMKSWQVRSFLTFLYCLMAQLYTIKYRYCLILFHYSSVSSRSKLIV